MAYTAQGANFAANSFGTATALSGVSDGKSGIASVWVNNPNALGPLRYVFWIGNASVQALFTLRFSGSQGTLICDGFNAALTNILSIRSLTVFSATTIWRHFLCSWNLAAPTGQVYVNDVNDIDTGNRTLTNDTIVYTGSNPALGATSNGSFSCNSNVADLQVWFNTGYFDLNIVSNRRLFIDQYGAPVNPTVAAAALGTPVILQTGAPASWMTNTGSGGGFTPSGTALAASPTNPTAVFPLPGQPLLFT